MNFTEGTAEAIKPTNALDYRFIRKAKSDSSVVNKNKTFFHKIIVIFSSFHYILKIKLVGNIWELGEGTFLLKLIDVVVNPENLM